MAWLVANDLISCLGWAHSLKVL